MEIGIMLYINCAVDIYEQIRVLKSIGVKHTFLNARHPEIDRIIDYIKKEDLICDNLHSEFWGEHESIKYDHQDLCRPGIRGDLMRDTLFKNIDTCARNGIPLIVIHDPHDRPELSINAYSRKRYTEIGDYARNKGVKIAFENTKYTRNLEYAISLVTDSVFCWDCGHEYCKLVGAKPMSLFSQRLSALHIHDNTLINDDHFIPFTAKIDFDSVAAELAESGYDGTLMLEIAYGSSEGNSTEATYLDFALKAKSAAEKLIKLVEEYR